MLVKNKKALDLIKKEFIKQKNNFSSSGTLSFSTVEIKSEFLNKMNIDVSNKSIEIGNLVLKKLWPSGNFSISLIDKNKDLDGLPLKNHSELLKNLQKMWDQGKEKISFQELQKLNIWTSLSTIKVGNFELYSGLFDGSAFSISLINKEKDAYNRWTNNAVDHKKVVKALNEFKLTKSNYKKTKETSLNAELEKHLRKYFDNCNKSKGNLKGIFDLEIGDLTYVIEIKMADSAKKTDQRDRAYGQMKRYLDEHKSKNFMLLVAGLSEDKQDHNIKSLKKAAEKEFGINFYFLEAE